MRASVRTSAIMLCARVAVQAPYVETRTPPPAPLYYTPVELGLCLAWQIHVIANFVFDSFSPRKFQRTFLDPSACIIRSA